MASIFGGIKNQALGIWNGDGAQFVDGLLEEAEGVGNLALRILAGRTFDGD